MPVVLHHTSVAGEPPAARRLFVMHGIYGRGRNWGAIARHLLARRPDWSSLLIDLRLHGESPAFAPPHTVDACAGDVLALEQEVGLAPRAVLGHSFGGKVALLVAARSDVRPLQVWVMDSTPEARAPEGAAWEMLAAIRALRSDFSSRLEAVMALQERGQRSDVAAWISTNLELVDGRYRWRLDLDAMEALLVDFFRTDLWDVIEQPPVGVDIRIVRATESPVLSAAACERVQEAGRRTGQVRLHEVNAGHWLNADNPDAVLTLLSAYLPRS